MGVLGASRGGRGQDADEENGEGQPMASSGGSSVPFQTAEGSRYQTGGCAAAEMGVADEERTGGSC